MSGAQIGVLEASELDRVTRWRFDELVRAGYDDDHAIEIAFRRDIDPDARSRPASSLRSSQRETLRHA